MNERWLEQIEDYLNGKMTAAERAAFELEMAGNAELSAAFHLYLTIESKMREYEYHIDKEAALKKTLERFGAQYSNIEAGDEVFSSDTKSATILQKASKIKRTKAWQWLLMAASLAGIIALGVVFYPRNIQEKPTAATSNKKADTTTVVRQDTLYTQPNNSSPEITKKEAQKAGEDKTTPKTAPDKEETLFASYFVPDAPPEDEDGPLEDAFAYYATGAYKEAAMAFEHADLNTVTRGMDDEALTTFYAFYYKALSYMAINDAAKAVPVLKKAIDESTNHLTKTKAQWYLSLAYLKTRKSKNAAELLDAIASHTQETAYKTKAAALLKALKKQ